MRRKNKGPCITFHLNSARRSPKAGPGAGKVRARLPGKPMNSVFLREPWSGQSRKPSPGAGKVRTRLPGKPMNSVFLREPWSGQSRKPSPAAFSVCVRFPGNPMNSVSLREPRPGGAPNPARRSPKPGPAANQKSRRVPAYFSASISSPSNGSNFTPYQWSGSSRVFLMQARV